MARYPVTNAQYQAFIDAGGYRSARQSLLKTVNNLWQGERLVAGSQADRSRKIALAQANRPRTNVDWYEAVAFSRWLSKQLGYEVRLPTEEEWERAARGHDGSQYPWGKAYEPVTPTSTKRQDRAGEWSSGADDSGRRLSAWSVERRGSRSGRATSGNGASTSISARIRFAADTSGDSRVLRGGSWLYGPGLARGSRRYWGHPDYRDYDWGFRLVSSAPIA
jgi:formylglycine-generating enzyme required for sulfatase activity